MNTKTLREIIYSPMKLIPKNCCIGYKDKVVHAILGLLIYVIVLILITPLSAIIVVYSAALTKELLDKYVINGTPDIMDFIATVTIPGIVTLIYYI